MNRITPQEFVDKWEAVTLKETASAQSHFEDVCRLVGHELPAAMDPHGDFFTYEKGMEKTGGGRGFADVWYDGHFAIEYKTKGKYQDFNGAYQQLLRYRENLKNPPLLVVCDIATWEIHTNWSGTEKQIYEFTNGDLLNERTLARIRDMFFAPDKLHPRRNTADVTADAAQVFQFIADNMRAWEADPDRIAHFLTKLVFCLFAEDIGLLPAGPKGESGIFSEIVERSRTTPSDFVTYTQQLFNAMADGGEMMFAKIPYFNGELFDDVQVERLEYEALNQLERAARLNWSSVEPSIFGTLFERSLDPGKRAQLGAHYTSRDDILLIVEPVLMQPLRRDWDAIQAEAQPIRQKYDQKGASGRQKKETGDQLLALRDHMLEKLRSVTVLDPACGSGNFLYVSLGLLLDLEKAVINNDLFAGIDDKKPQPRVHPRQLYGIEINPIAHALASIVVWIGYIQWRQQNGYFDFKEPILEYLEANIQCKDAILAFDDEGNPIEPEWATVDVIVGNPPFLGGKKLITELGEEYISNVRKAYADRLPGFTDLVTYWFEHARSDIAKGRVGRAGLLATNSIGMGTNLTVLKRIKETGDIFMAYPDRSWVLDGAAVRVAMIGFDDGSETLKILDGNKVEKINPDLTAMVDLTQAKKLRENQSLGFIGTQKSGSFDVDSKTASDMLSQINASGVSNSDVIRRWVNGLDITRRSRNMYIIDFDPNMNQDEVSQYIAPYKYVVENVKPTRTAKHFENYPFWLFWNTRPEMRQKLTPLSHYIATARVAKHRVFVWLEQTVIPDSQVVAFARDDDYFFGVLHSTLHEVWSLRMGTSLEDRPRYTPTTTFETFPFPWSPNAEPINDERYHAIAAAAKQLHEERDAWLNPEGVSAKGLKDRTLTNLYNALNVLRGKESIKIKASAGDFAPRLDGLHQALDEAVCAAYNWEVAVLKDEEEILRRLLELNLKIAAEQ